MRYSLTLFVLLVLPLVAQAQEDPQTRHYQKVLRPVMVTHCFDCHNGGDKKAGLNLEDVYFASSIIRGGATWVKVVEQIKSGEMPPNTKPRIPEADKELLVSGIEALLDSALSIPDPGRIVMRRLSNREYRYTVLDLMEVDFDAQNFFPSDPSGGEGFDNHASALYMTPLQMERYLQAADTIVSRAYEGPEVWKRLTSTSYRSGIWQSITQGWKSLWNEEEAKLEAAAGILFPFAARAYRRFLSHDEKEQLLKVFREVYPHVKDEEDGFDQSIQEAIKYVLVSPGFLYRREANVPADKPYPITDFELASRLSYFLWSSAPDQTLLDIAYRGELHQPSVLRTQLTRMLQDPRSRRLAESFAGQWLEVDGLLETHEVDPTLYPEYTESLRRAMYDETIAFFHHILTSERSFLDILDSDYAFLNAELAEHYGIDGIEHEDVRFFSLADARRGGVLGQAGVLTTTSFPTRTSPVIRGQWILTQLLGTPPAPPPADVPELEESGESIVDELDLRALLSKHREPSACYGCHQKMDPLGFALENFDAIGRWRDRYDTELIDASGMLPNGDTFEGPAELRKTLLKRKEDFARNLSRKMLGFALGRSIRFQDKKTIDALTANLLENNFDSSEFLFAIVSSFPFLYKKSDIRN